MCKEMCTWIIKKFKILLCAIIRAFYVFGEKCASRFIVHLSFIVCASCVSCETVRFLISTKICSSYIFNNLIILICIEICVSHPSYFLYFQLLFISHPIRCANRCASLIINNFKNLLCAITRAFYVFREKCASRFVVHISFIVCEKKYVQVVYHVRLWDFLCI